MRRKQIKYAPTYFSRPFNTEEEAQDYISRMRLKMGVDYIYDISYDAEDERWKGRFWDKIESEKGYIVK